MSRDLQRLAGAVGPLTISVGTASGIAIAYFLAARLGLALRATPSDVAVFWPASGIAAGILVVAQRRAWPAVVIGLVVGTIAANLLSDRSLLTSIFKGFCNAGEAVVVAWLVERWFGRPFMFGDLRRIAGFLVAASIATATSAIGGAATMTLLHTSAPFWDVWRAWFLSDGIGIVMVTPLVIALEGVWCEQPSRGELIEGTGVLALVALISFYMVTHPTESWLSFSPGAAVLPLLLWLTTRCLPAFPIAGQFSPSCWPHYSQRGVRARPNLPASWGLLAMRLSPCSNGRRAVAPPSSLPANPIAGWVTHSMQRGGKIFMPKLTHALELLGY